MTVISLVADGLQRNALLSMVLLLFWLIGISVRFYQSPWRRLPPEPRGLPLLGNLHQMIHGKQWVTFSKWKEIYGPIFYLNVVGHPIIVLGSLNVAADLLDRRALIYSDRPRFIVASEMMTEDMLMVLMGFNNLWKRMRKASQEQLNRTSASKYQTIQLQEAIILAEDLLTNGKEWNNHVERVAASFMTSMVYGVPTYASGESGVVKISEFMGRLAAAALPGTYLVEFFTWMKYIPVRFAGWKRRVLKAFEKDSALFQELFDSAIERKENGDDRPILAATLRQDKARNQLSDTECSWLAATMYGAGSETTAGVLAWWLLAMLMYPETQKQAQEEIDRVVGRDRVPAFADMKNMPYVQAMVKEALRWGTVAHLGAPHCLMEVQPAPLPTHSDHELTQSKDDWYNGYFLPKGSIVISNIWAINRDPSIFGEDACHFNPGRYLDGKGQIAAAPADTKEEGHVSYGFGRRICVGRHVANNSLSIDIATVLWAMTAERTKDERGELVPLDVDGVVDRGLAIRPVPFVCKITSRSPNVLAILQEAKA